MEYLADLVARATLTIFTALGIALVNMWVFDITPW